MSRPPRSTAPALPAAALSAAAPPDLDAMLKRLHLPTIRRLHAELAVRAEAEGMGYRAYLDILVAPVATSNSPICGRVKLPQLTCAGRGEVTVLSPASQDAQRLL